MTSEDAELEPLRLAALAGEAGAMEVLLHRVQPLLHRRCARLLPHRPDAEEAAQDALLAVSTRLATFSGRGSFSGWLQVVASNCARSTYRDLRRRFVEEHGVDSLIGRRPEARTTSVIAGSRLDLLDALESLEATRPAVVEAFVLRDLGGLSYDEIAERTGTKLGTVKARIHEARAFVRTRLTDRLA
jgi:RNA polymerase sigma factor (sigma-70 family)